MRRSPIAPTRSFSAKPLQSARVQSRNSTFYCIGDAMKKIAALTVTVLLLLACPANSAILTGKGNAPVRDPGWPAGADAVANLKTRIAWWEGPPFGGGQWCFQYRGDAAALNEAMAALSQIRAASVQIVLHDGPGESPFLRDEKDPKADTSFDWSFTVWVPMNWHRLFNDPRTTFMSDAEEFRRPVDPPRIDVYLTRRIDWSKVRVPENVKLLDTRTPAAQRPNRGAAIKAEVFDTATGRPIVKPILRVDKSLDQGKWEQLATATGNADGRVSLTDISAGPARVVVTADNYATRVISYEPLKDGQAQTVIVELCRLETLKGFIKDGAGKPLAGVKVYANNVMGIDGRGYRLQNTPQSVSDGNGAFVITGLPLGFTCVFTHADGLRQTTHVRSVLAIPTPDLVITVEGTPVINKRPAADRN
jgi:hypothetical protein